MSKPRPRPGLLLLASMLVALNCPAAQPSFALLHSLFDPGTNAQAGAMHGQSVAVDGNVIVVGAPWDDSGGSESGVVQVYDATSGALSHTLTNPSPASGDLFGMSVAVSGQHVVVGAIWDDTGANAAGVAHVYDLAGATPTTPMLTLTNPGPAVDERFGQSVAIAGARVVVGAHRDGTGASDSGAVYVYDLAGAVPGVPILTIVNPSHATEDSFGFSVALSGTRVAVGAHRDDIRGTDGGAAYVFDLASSTPDRPVFGLGNPTPPGSDYFGWTVAISGTRLLIGAIRDDAGAADAGMAYVYDLAGAAPYVPVVTLTNPAPTMDGHFGYSVAISGTRVLIGAERNDVGADGAGVAYVYELSSATPGVPALTLTNPTPSVQERFGSAVALSGVRAVVGADREASRAFAAGAAYIYDLASAAPATPLAVLDQTGPASYEFFGDSVAVSGKLMVVGAWGDDTGAENAGRAYVYDLSSPTPSVPAWTLNNPHAAAYDLFGRAVAISGTRVVVGAVGADVGVTNAGCAYVFDLSVAAPGVPVLTLTNPAPSVGAYFGWPVALSGSRLIVGAHLDDTGATDSGMAYVYDLAGPEPALPKVVLANPTPYYDDRFGAGVTISGTRVAVSARHAPAGGDATGRVCVYDLSSLTPGTPTLVLTNPPPVYYYGYPPAVALSGLRLLVGAQANYNVTALPGNTYVYDLEGATPAIPVLTLTNPTPTSNHWFGSAVALDGGLAVIGTFRDVSGTVDSGLAFVYDLDSPIPTTLLATLANPSPAPHDEFGGSVAVQGGTILIGAPGDDTGAVDRGAAYVFVLRPTLSIVPSAPGLATLSWTPTNSPGFLLQYTESLSPTNWVNAPSGAMNPVTISTTNAGRFYRLFQP